MSRFGKAFEKSSTFEAIHPEALKPGAWQEGERFEDSRLSNVLNVIAQIASDAIAISNTECALLFASIRAVKKKPRAECDKELVRLRDVVKQLCDKATEWDRVLEGDELAATASEVFGVRTDKRLKALR